MLQCDRVEANRSSCDSRSVSTGEQLPPALGRLRWVSTICRCWFRERLSGEGAGEGGRGLEAKGSRMHSVD